MSYTPIIGLLVALPLLGTGGNAAGGHSAADAYALPKAEPPAFQLASVMPETGVDTEALALVPQEPAEPVCADLDKHKQLRGRIAPSIVRTASSLLKLPRGAGRF